MRALTHPQLVTPAQAGPHPGFCISALSDTTRVRRRILADGWADPRLRGDDGAYEVISVVEFSIVAGAHL